MSHRRRGCCLSGLQRSVLADSFSPSTIAIFAILYYLLSAWTYGISVSSGLFIPALLTGAAWGRLVGIGVEALFPDATGLDPGMNRCWSQSYVEEGGRVQC